jgi:hypothetical protein
LISIYVAANYLAINTNTRYLLRTKGKRIEVADGNLTVVPTVDNQGYPVYKIELPDVILGLAKNNTLDAFSSIALTYDIKVKSNAPTVPIKLNELLYVSPRNMKVSDGYDLCNYADEFDVDGDGDVPAKRWVLYVENYRSSNH